MTDATSRLLKYHLSHNNHPSEYNFCTQALTVIIPLFGFNYFLTLVGPDREESEFWYMVFQIGRSVLIRWGHFYLLLDVRAEPNICYIITLLFSRNRSPTKSNLQKHSFLPTFSYSAERIRRILLLQDLYRQTLPTTLIFILVCRVPSSLCLTAS